MRYVVCLVCLLSLMTGRCADARRLSLEEYNARRNTSSTERQYVRRSHRYQHGSRRSSTSDGSSHANASAVAGPFERLSPAIRFPFHTGTSILDNYEGRLPAIMANSCADPQRDVRMFLVLDAFARY